MVAASVGLLLGLRRARGVITPRAPAEGMAYASVCQHLYRFAILFEQVVPARLDLLVIVSGLDTTVRSAL